LNEPEFLQVVSLYVPKNQEGYTMRPSTAVSGPRLAALLTCCAIVACLLPAALAQPVDADRIRVRLSGGQFEILSVTPLTTVLPPSESPAGTSGFWFELRDGAGDVRYRRVIDDPLRLVFEGPELIQNNTRSAPAEIRLMSLRPDRKERTAFKGPVAIPHGAVDDRVATSTRMKTMATAERNEAIPEVRVFTVLVPRTQDGDELVLLGPPLVVGGQAEAAQDLAHLALTSGGTREAGHE